MSAAQKTVGISSSVAVFLLIVSICCVLSLSSRDLPRDNLDNSTKSIVVPSYVPNIALICILLDGITAMVIFICKKVELTVRNDGCQFTRRHDLHRKYSFYSIAVFYIGICTLDMNYLLVVFSCKSNWLDCWPNNMEYFLTNVVLVIFHIVGTIFAVLQVVACVMVRHMNFKPSQWVWHILAFVLAANITMWFHSLLRESYHRIEEQDVSLGAYFSFCNYTTLKNESDPFSCSDTSSVATWFLLSAPILFPITIEFNLLVTETLLDRSIGAESHNVIENAEECDSDEENEMDTLAANYANEPDEQTPILHVNEYLNTENNSIVTKTFIPISVLINIVNFVLTVLVFIGSKDHDRQSQNFNDALAVYRCIYYSFLAICSVTGMVSSRGFKRQQHSHTSFLEYLFLLSTSGILFQSLKKLVAFSSNAGDRSIFPAYYMTEVLDLVHVNLQIVFYYYAKDVKLQFNNGGNASVGLPRIRNVMFAISISNCVEWILNSFVYPHIYAHMTPTKDYAIEPWPAYDNVMIPIYIFFRFSSALLFWCLYRDLSPPDDHHRDGVASIHFPQQTVHPRRSVDGAPASSYRPTSSTCVLRSRPGPPSSTAGTPQSTESI